MFWKTFRQCPQIEQFCRDFDGYTLYGESIGNKELNYGFGSGKVGYAAFDIMKPDGTWFSYEEFAKTCDHYGIPRVPVLYIGPYSFECVCLLSDGPSLFNNAKHHREGIVIRSYEENTSKFGIRKCFKVVGATYLEKSKS